MTVSTLRNAPTAIVTLRIGSSLAWVESAFIGKDAKLAPSFLSGAGLAERIGSTFAHTAASPQIAELLRTVVLPHAQVFAILIALGDAVAGISLALGFYARVGGAIAILRALTNIAVAGGAGPDTIGYNAMLALAGGLVIWTDAGRLFGIDGLRHGVRPSRRAYVR